MLVLGKLLLIFIVLILLASVILAGVFVIIGRTWRESIALSLMLILGICVFAAVSYIGIKLLPTILQNILNWCMT